MRLEHYDRLKTLFDDAVQLPHERRKPFVDDLARDDPGLASDLRRMLEADDAAGRDDAPHTMPERIGEYAILGVLGVGGMGVVYRARQRQPRRDVALKVLRPGAFAQSMMRRFRYEAEILGRLRHPGIAQVYVAGTWDSDAGGQPFFAMELVEG